MGLQCIMKTGKNEVTDDEMANLRYVGKIVFFRIHKVMMNTIS